MKISAIIFFLLIVTTGFAKEPDVTAVEKETLENQRWNHIHGLINEEIKTINMAKKKSQKLMYRLFELKSEKIKL